MMGSIRNLMLFMILIMVHELGHFLIAKLLGWKTDKIYIYPYGGVSKFNEKVNVALKEEFLVLIAGPITQVMFFFMLSKILPERYLSTFSLYHYFILIFNLLPVYPLDGGRLLSLVMEEVLPFKKSLYLSIRLSYITIVLVLIYIFYDFSLFLFFVLLLTLDKVYEERKKLDFIFEKFLLERRMYNFFWKKKKVIREIGEMKRDCYHYFKDNDNYYKEEEILLKRYLQTKF